MSKNCLLLILIILLTTHPTLGSDFPYIDPKGIYEISIPPQWIFQSGQSSEEVSVFYGPSRSELLYIEHLENITDVDEQAFAARTLEALQKPGGLKDLSMEGPYISHDIDGRDGVSVLYSFLSSSRNRQWEKRYFVLLPNRQGVTITMSDTEENFPKILPVIEQLIEEWRWLM